MKSRFHRLHRLLQGLGLLLLLEAPGMLHGEPPPPAANAAFDTYTLLLEARLSRQHRRPETFLNPLPSSLADPEPVLERLSPPPAAMPAGALLHHWRATAFVPGAHAADFERLLRQLDAYPRVFSPEVLQAHVLSTVADHLQASLRVRQHHVLTVVLDTTYDITFGSLDPQHGSSISRSLSVTEVAAPGTPAEHALPPAEDHGFLWRQNTYWSWAERDRGSNPGLELQLESVSLTRAIPAGLGWAVRPYVESIPRESLEFTLRAAANALQQPHDQH